MTRSYAGTINPCAFNVTELQSDMGKRPAKLADLIAKVRNAVRTGRYWDTYHVEVENPARGRAITRLEMRQILETGRPEPARDRFDDGEAAWSYAFRGKTVDGRELRVIVAFHEDRMVIVSAYELSLENESDGKENR